MKPLTIDMISYVPQPVEVDFWDFLTEGEWEGIIVKKDAMGLRTCPWG